MDRRQFLRRPLFGAAGIPAIAFARESGASRRPGSRFVAEVREADLDRIIIAAPKHALPPLDQNFIRDYEKAVHDVFRRRD